MPTVFSDFPILSPFLPQVFLDLSPVCPRFVLTHYIEAASRLILVEVGWLFHISGWLFHIFLLTIHIFLLMSHIFMWTSHIRVTSMSRKITTEVSEITFLAGIITSVDSHITEIPHLSSNLSTFNGTNTWIYLILLYNISVVVLFFCRTSWVLRGGYTEYHLGVLRGQY